MGIRAEFQQFLEKAKAASADGKWTLDEVDEVAVEFLDVLRPALSALDPEDTAAIDALVDDAEDIALELIDELPGGRFVTKNAARAGVTFVVPWLIRSAVAASDPVDDWIKAEVVPYVRLTNSVSHALLVNLGE
jgi:hypothetical protein